MYSKKCPKCDQYSYSSSKKGMWRCPYCGTDISDVRVEEKEPDNYSRPDNVTFGE